MNLLKLLPLRLQDREIGLFQEAWQPLFDDLVAAQEDFVLQLDPTTATWGLEHWETALGITTDVTASDEYRRTVVVAALRGAGTSTVAAIQNLAESFSNGEVEVTEYPDAYRIEIKFTSIIGIPPNMDDLSAALDGMMPAHLEYSYVILYRTWSALEDGSWGVLEGATWSDVYEGEIAS